MNENLFIALMASGDDAGRVAIELPDGRRVRYDELDELAAGYAAALEAVGTQPGDRVVAVLAKSVHAIAAYLATLRAGAVFVPINPSYTTTELAYFISDAQPAVVLCAPARADELAAACERADATMLTADADGAGTLAEAAARATARPVVPRGRDDLAAILYTSGTTGRSKGAMLTHGNLAANAETLRAQWRFSCDDTLVHALPVFHTHGLFVGINVSFLARATVLLLPRFEVASLADALRRATVLMGVPTYYSRLLEVPDLRERASSIRLFVSGSAPLLAETHRAWAARTGHAILERYGMTETTMLTSNPIDGERRPGTVGRPLPGVELRLAEPNAQGIGSIQVRGPNVFVGYWGLPERSAAEFTDDGFFITGDLGRIDADGYVEIVGREKDLVITGGYNVYPKEVELVLDAVDGVGESAVFGVPDADLGERVIAAIVPASPTAPTADDLDAHLAEHLARYKRPHDYVVLPALPRNVMGKVQKNELRTRYSSDDGTMTEPGPAASTRKEYTR
ncbi:malonyl-CoA synthase [Pseudoclavibacter endophyticus]|nr:AMP-binding protein [Pseudoclavibacter endophyticus]GGA67409.1 malonyl-CoA synthase [Pseudoclavibacter endophyticus]